MPDESFPAPLIPVEEAARRFGVSEQWVRVGIKSGELEVVRIGGRVLFRPEFVEKYIEEHTVEASAA